MEKKCIYIQTQKEGYHYWKNAPEEVSFLRYVHRHMFHIKIAISVIENDRELEFFLFKKDVVAIINYIWKIKKLENSTIGAPLSCEHIGTEIKSKLYELYPDRYILIEISEDNENGVIL